MKNVFSDKASIIAREMLADPDRKWVLRDFVGIGGLSLGMAQGVLAAMQEMGCLERLKKGPASFSRLADRELLLSEWVKWYRFSVNAGSSYYTPDIHFLKKLKKFIPADKYALTLHAGGNLITSYVNTDETHVYLRLDNWAEELPLLRQKLELKKLARGGNVHFIRPFYRIGAFHNILKINGFSVVSSLQLYLDLYNFQPRGRDHAEYLKETVTRKGGLLA